MNRWKGKIRLARSDPPASSPRSIVDAEWFFPTRLFKMLKSDAPIALKMPATIPGRYSESNEKMSATPKSAEIPNKISFGDGLWRERSGARIAVKKLVEEKHITPTETFDNLMLA